MYLFRPCFVLLNQSSDLQEDVSAKRQSFKSDVKRQEGSPLTCPHRKHPVQKPSSEKFYQSMKVTLKWKKTN